MSFNLPLHLTMLRFWGALAWIVLAPALYDFGASGVYIAVGLYCLLFSTDWIDGRLARAWNQVSRIGAHCDPMADKVLSLAGLVYGLVLGSVAPWVVVLLIARDFAVMTMREMALQAQVYISVSMWAKCKTAMLFIYTSIALAYPVWYSYGWYQPLLCSTLIVSIILSWASAAQYYLRARDVITKV